MDYFDRIKSFNQIFDITNRLTSSMNSLNTVYFNNTTINFLKKLESDTYKHNISLHNHNFLNANSFSSVFSKIDKSLYPSSVIETLNTVANISRWSDLAKISILHNFESILEEDNYEVLVSEFNDNINAVSCNIEEFDKNLIYHINNFLNFFSNYLKENPIPNLSFYVFQTLLLAYIGNIIFSNSEPTLNVNNNITINQTIRNGIVAKVNINSLDLRSFARNNSKKVGILAKNTEVEILKDSIKWTFVIEKNTTKTGWVRKEYLKFVE